MPDRTCRGCPAVIVPAARERKPRVWCSESCRVRYWTANNPVTVAAMAERTRLRHEAMMAARRGNCPYCAVPLPTGRSKCCGAIECIRAMAAARMRRLYAADPEAARQRAVAERACWTAAQRSAARAKMKRRKLRVGYEPSKREGDARRRARKAAVGVEKFNRAEVFDRDRWKCGICGKKIDRKLSYPDPMSVSLDHIVPISQGGDHSRANTRASNLACNIRRNVGRNEVVQLFLI